jgi:hypothetical protein
MIETLLPKQTILDANSFIRIATQDNLAQARTAMDFLKNNIINFQIRYKET